MKVTNPLWYLAGLFVALACLMGGAAVGAQAWQPVRDATVTPVSQNIVSDGRTIAVYTDIVQPDRDVSCHLAAASDRKRVDIPAAPIDLTADDDGNQWHLVGLIRQGPQGEIRVACNPRDKRVDDATYAAAAVDGYTSKTTTGKGIAILGVTAGGLFCLVVAYQRRERKREVTRGAV